MTLRSAICALVLCSSVAACGGGGASSTNGPTAATSGASETTTQPASTIAESTATPSTASSAGAEEGTLVTQQQAEVLARLLLKNGEAGGIRVEGLAPFTGGSVVPFKAEVDLKRVRGHIVFAVPAGDIELYWDKDRVFQPTQESRGKSPAKTKWESVPARPDEITAHKYLQFLTRLGAETIDNAAVIRNQGTRFIRPDAVGDVPTDVYAYGKTGLSKYYVGQADGLLYRVEATFGELGDATFDITARGPEKVVLPPVVKEVA